MRIRRQKNQGNWRWVCDFQDGKGKRRQRFFAEHEDALTFANTVTAETPSRRQGPSYTLRDLCDAFLNATSARRGEAATKSAIYKCRAIVKALAGLQVRYVNQISELTFARLVQAFEGQGLSPHSVRSYMNVWRAAMNWSVGKKVLTSSDVGDMRLRKPQKGKERFLSKDEITTLLSHLAGTTLQLPVALGIYQGLRRGEVCQLRTQDLDLDRRELTVLQSKNRDWRVIQLHPSLLPHVPEPLPNREHLCANGDGEPWQGDALRRRLRSYLDKLGPQWGDVSFHTLRHTCASQMVLTGRYTLYQIGQFLGHRSLETTRRYAHLLPGQVKPEW